MYAKIFAQIYDGTLCTNHPWQALVTFQQFLVLADQDGTVDMTAKAISRRTGIPLDIIELGISELLLPDPESRTPDEDGRRIIPLVEHREWGWKVVNYVTYRSLKREEDRREYHRRYYQEKRSVSAISTKNVETQQPQPIQPIAYAEAEEVNNKTLVDADASPPVDKPPRGINCPHQKLLDLYHAECKSLAKVARYTESRKAAMAGLWKAVMKEEKYTTEARGLEYFEGYFNWVEQSDFLCGRTGNGQFMATFDWILKPANFTKTIEGNYHRRAA